MIVAWGVFVASFVKSNAELSMLSDAVPIPPALPRRSVVKPRTTESSTFSVAVVLEADWPDAQNPLPLPGPISVTWRTFSVTLWGASGPVALIATSAGAGARYR